MTREEAVRIFRKEVECLSHAKCEDCILEKVCDPAITTPLDSEYIEAYGMAIQALSQEPTDVISRDAVIEATYHCGDLQEVRGVVQQLPPVMQKSGKWIKVKSGDKDFPESIVCSKCGRENSHLDFNENAEPIGKVFVTSKFCPNCGCRMLFNRSTENHELNKNLDKEEGEKHE